MLAFYIYGSVIAAMFLYGNTVSLLVKIKNDKDPTLNTILGVILCGFIMYSIVMFFAQLSTS